MKEIHSLPLRVIPIKGEKQLTELSKEVKSNYDKLNNLEKEN